MCPGTYIIVVSLSLMHLTKGWSDVARGHVSCELQIGIHYSTTCSSVLCEVSGWIAFIGWDKLQRELAPKSLPCLSYQYVGSLLVGSSWRGR